MIKINRSKSGFGMDWTWGQTGYMAYARGKFRLMHRFLKKGTASLGNEKFFMGRIEIGLDKEPRISFLTFEAVNPFEARWFLFIMKIWKGVNFVFVFNFGWTLSMESRKTLQQNYYSQMQSKAMEAQNLKQKINAGGKDQWRSQKQSLKVV